MVAYIVILLAIAGVGFAALQLRRRTSGRRRAARRQASHIHIRTSDRDD